MKRSFSGYTSQNIMYSINQKSIVLHAIAPLEKDGLSNEWRPSRWIEHRSLTRSVTFHGSDPSKHIVSIIGMDHKDTNMLRHIVQLNLTKHDWRLMMFVHALINNTWNAMIIQVTAMAGDNLSPIRLAFQQIPHKPRCWAAVEVDVALSSADFVVNIEGYNARRNDVEQMNNKITIINDGKSNKALIFSSIWTVTTNQRINWWSWCWSQTKRENGDKIEVWPMANSHSWVH